MTDAERSTISAELYMALRRYQNGVFAKAIVGVGMLPVDLSQVVIAVENKMRELR